MKKVDFTLNEITENPQRFFVGIARWLSEPNVTISLKGEAEKVKVVQEALRSTKEFQNELNRPSSTLTSVSDKLAKKHSAAEEFDRVIKVSWPF